MSYSLVEAAIACGVNRSTVLRAIKASKISTSKDEQGEWRIEPAELHRVYPPVQANEARPERAHQETLIAELRNALSDMRRDRDEWREQAQRFALLAPKAEPVQPKPEPALIEQPSRLRRAWRWMRATGCLAGAACCSSWRLGPLALSNNSSSRNSSRRQDASRLRSASARRATLRAQFCSTVAPARRGCCSA